MFRWRVISYILIGCRCLFCQHYDATFSPAEMYNTEKSLTRCNPVKNCCVIWEWRVLSPFGSPRTNCQGKFLEMYSQRNLNSHMTPYEQALCDIGKENSPLTGRNLWQSWTWIHERDEMAFFLFQPKCKFMNCSFLFFFRRINHTYRYADSAGIILKIKIKLFDGNRKTSHKSLPALYSFSLHKDFSTMRKCVN